MMPLLEESYLFRKSGVDRSCLFLLTCQVFPLMNRFSDTNGKAPHLLFNSLLRPFNLALADLIAQYFQSG